MHNVLMWWWTGSQLMMMLLGWVVMWSTYHLIFVRGIVRWDYHNLLLLTLLVSSDCVIHDDGIVH
jgi:hypothetical protein